MDFIEILKAIILGIVQGFTEFLPISSSGHLTLVQDILGMQGNLLYFDILLHVGTLIAVAVAFFKHFVELIKKPFSKPVLLLIIATIPAIISGILFEDYISESFTGSMLAITFMATAILLYLVDIIGNKLKNKRALSYPTALAMGLAQAIAVFPGLSRSGLTISAGIMMKGDRKEVAKFSFTMSFIIILGAAGYSIFKILKDSNSIGIGSNAIGLEIGFVAILCGMVASAISGYIAIRWMLRLIEKCNFKWFSLYLTILSIIVILNYQFLYLW